MHVWRWFHDLILQGHGEHGNPLTLSSNIYALKWLSASLLREKSDVIIAPLNCGGSKMIILHASQDVYR